MRFDQYFLIINSNVIKLVEVFHLFIARIKEKLMKFKQKGPGGIIPPAPDSV
jgi:hypothetical protein